MEDMLPPKRSIKQMNNLCKRKQMTANILIEAITDAVSASGYTTQCGDSYRIVTDVKSLPMVWLITPELRGVEGRDEGVAYYKTEFKILERLSVYSAADKLTKLAQMEQAARKICVLLTKDERVKDVSGIKYTVEEFSLTNKGEMSLTVSCEVTVPFYRQVTQL